MAPRAEQYTIYEMFLDVRGIDSCINFEDFGRQLREHVRNGTGLTDYQRGYGTDQNAGEVSAMGLQRMAAVWRKASVNAGKSRRTDKMLSL